MAGSGLMQSPFVIWDGQQVSLHSNKKGLKALLDFPEATTTKYQIYTQLYWQLKEKKMLQYPIITSVSST